MEYQKITNLLGTTIDEIPRFITRKWVEVHDQSGSADDRYKPNKQVRFKTSILRSDLCDYSDAYIVVKGDITLTKTNGRGIIDIRNRFLAFKNNAPLTNCVSKIYNVLIDNAEDLDVVMSMCNLLEYIKDEPNNPPAANYNADPITHFESFKYKSSITGKTSNANQENGENTEQGNTKTKKNLEIIVSLKHLSIFLRLLVIPLINCQVFLTVTWSENCVLNDNTTQAARAAQGDNPGIPAINAPTSATIVRPSCYFIN